MNDYLICYDIAHPGRLQRIFRQLKKRAVPLQYSVFLYSGEDRQLVRLMARIEQYIDPQEDDLRVYPLPRRGYRARLGRACLPEGIQWSRLPVGW